MSIKKGAESLNVIKLRKTHCRQESGTDAHKKPSPRGKEGVPVAQAYGEEGVDYSMREPVILSNLYAICTKQNVPNLIRYLFLPLRCACGIPPSPEGTAFWRVPALFGCPPAQTPVGRGLAPAACTNSRSIMFHLKLDIL